MRPEGWRYTIPLRLRSLLRREQADQELDGELREHLERATEEFIATGMTAEEARRRARLDLGGIEQTKEKCRDTRQVSWIQDFVQDLVYALRILRKSPGFTCVAIVTLALGIGATTAVFSVLNPILFASLPYPHASRVMMIWDIFQGSRSDVTFHTFRELANRSHSFESTAAFEAWRPTLTGANEPEHINGQSVTADYFRVLGISPALGRDFQSVDTVFHGPKVVVLSATLWIRRFGADRDIIGKAVTLDGDSFQIIGVMPPSFENVLAPSSELWRPMQYDTTRITDLQSAEWGHHLRMIARLRRGLSQESASQELRAIASSPVSDFPRAPWASMNFGFILNSVQSEVTRDVRPALLAVFAAVLLVLAIVCVNVANLLLARSSQRCGEFAVRAALGATRKRILRQALTESLLLCLFGGILGMLVAQLGVQALRLMAPGDLPRLTAISLDRSVFAFGVTITALIGVVIGLIPALYASRRDLKDNIQSGGRRTSGGHQTVGRALVVAEVSLAVLLLVGAGLLLRSLRQLLAVDPGFQPSHVLAMQVQTSGHKYENDDVRRRFFDEVLAEVRRVTGVSSASLTSLLPLSDKREVLIAGTYGTFFERSQRGHDVFLYAVSPEYFQTLGIPLRRGRPLENRDVAQAPQAVLISESLAKREFGDTDPVGQRVHVGPVDRPWYTVVGVAADVKQTSLAVTDLDAVYMTPEQQWFADEAMYVVVRTVGTASTFAPAVRNAIWSVDKNQAVLNVATMDDLLAASSAQRRFVLLLFESFGVVALMLAAIGIYGVLSATVTERFREIGIRSALGASRKGILAQFLREGLILAAIGCEIGLTAAFIGTQAMTSLLFGVSSLDPATYFGVILLLALVSTASCLAPAWRASRVDPMIALRYE
jgi:putative ABC transport system permease protein